MRDFISNSSKAVMCQEMILQRTKGDCSAVHTKRKASLYTRCWKPLSIES